MVARYFTEIIFHVSLLQSDMEGGRRQVRKSGKVDLLGILSVGHC